MLDPIILKQFSNDSDAANQEDYDNEPIVQNDHACSLNQDEVSANKTFVIRDPVIEESSENNDKTFVASNSDRESESGKHPLLEACKCKNKYCVDVSEECRKSLHREFWRLDYDQRKQWIFSHVKTYEPARRYVERQTNKKKRITRRYWLPVLNTQVRVCPVS